MNIFEEEIKNQIADLTQLKDVKLEVPPDNTLGDFAFPCFQLAKLMKKSPNQIALDLKEGIKKSENIENVEAKGPYVNFFVNKKKVAEITITEILKSMENYGRQIRTGKTILIEYSAPNTNKPQHLGHIRNNLLGMSIANILEFQGNKVVRINWINDRGIHICKSMLAYMKWGQNANPNIKGDHFVGGFYIMYNKLFNENPKIEDEAKEMLLKWEQGDENVKKIWRKMTDWALEGFKETYKSMGCEFDKWYFESDIYEKGKEIVEKGLKKGAFIKGEDGEIYANLESYGLPNKVFLRQDGSSIYSTADLALGAEKSKYNFYKSIYCIGSEQNLYMKQLFKTFEILGYPWATSLYHLSYGMVYLPEGKMKSREGIVIDADDIIKEIKEVAKKEIVKRNDNITREELESRAEKIGIGALKFFILKTDQDKDIYYDPKESISFEGETGPYVQYAYARIKSILRKYDEEIKECFDFAHKTELKLISQLSRFEKVCREAAEQLKPHIISRYLLDVAQTFNEFYHACPILTEKEKVKNSRLILISATAQVLKNGLLLIGISVPEKM